MYTKEYIFEKNPTDFDLSRHIINALDGGQKVHGNSSYHIRPPSPERVNGHFWPGPLSGHRRHVCL